MSNSPRLVSSVAFTREVARQAKRRALKCSVQVENLEERQMMASGAFVGPFPSPIVLTALAPVSGQVTQNSPMTAQQRMAAFGLTNINGMCYTPQPSDDFPQQDPPAPAPPQYFDSDFWNSAFSPMWSSQQNIPGFKSAQAVNGRGDLATMKTMGVNFLHLFDWNPQRDHNPFLSTALSDGITVNVPVSNFAFALAQNAPLNPGTFVFRLEFVHQIFNTVYPNGSTTPNPDIKMWTIANEPDIAAINPVEVGQIAQMIVYLENQANIPDANRLPIGIPFSYATHYNGQPGENPTPGVQSVQIMFNAFASSSSFTSTDIGGNPVTVPALPSNFFTSRFVATINPDGNDNAAFLGLQKNPPYPSFFAPGNADPRISWSTMPVFFTEDGPSSRQEGSNPQMQAQILQKQLTDCKNSTLKGIHPNFDGTTVFQWLDQIAQKTGAEQGFGVNTFQTGVFQTLEDVPPTVVPPGGAGTWRLDTLVQKPAFAVIGPIFNSY